MRLDLILSLLLAPGAALAIQPDCFGAGLAAQESGQGDYNVLAYPGGLVFYQRNGDPWGVELVVEHCPGRDRVAATLYPVPDAETVDPAEARALADRFLAALEATETYTFGDLARMADRAGANVWQGRVDYVSCACRLRWDE